jgi:hypothetical protein
MIATALLVSNIDEIMENKRQIEVLGMTNIEYVKPIMTEREFCFPLNLITCAFRKDDGNIKMILNGQEISLVYEEAVYNRIREHFKNI